MLLAQAGGIGRAPRPDSPPTMIQSRRGTGARAPHISVSSAERVDLEPIRRSLDVHVPKIDRPEQRLGRQADALHNPFRLQREQLRHVAIGSSW